MMINEFQSYLMQQPVAEVDSYFKGFAVPRFRIDSPDDVAFTNSMLAEFPDTFVRTARQVSDAAMRSAGMKAGSLETLVRR